jgi:hypothetical protein
MRLVIRAFHGSCRSEKYQALTSYSVWLNASTPGRMRETLWYLSGGEKSWASDNFPVVDFGLRYSAGRGHLCIL